MAIPAFNEHGILPEGVHDCSLAEIGERFGQFQRTDARCRLFEQLKGFLGQVSATGFVIEVIIDGSFVTAKDDPNDIDLILVLRSNHDFSAALRTLEYNVLSRHEVRRIWRFDMLLAQEGKSATSAEIEFFSLVRDRPELRKGMVRVQL